MFDDAVGGAQLSASPLFRGLPPERVAGLPELFERGDALFIIETGLVEVILVSATGEVTVLTRLGPGEAFGEMAVLTGEPRSAGIRAVSPTTVRVIERE